MGEMSWNPIPFPSYYILGKRGTISAVQLFVFEKKVHTFGNKRNRVLKYQMWKDFYAFDWFFPKKQVPISSHSSNQFSFWKWKIKSWQLCYFWEIQYLKVKWVITFKHVQRFLFHKSNWTANGDAKRRCPFLRPAWCCLLTITK